MKVLLVNWSWYPSGGDWTYVENVHKLYESNGFEVIPFSTQNEKNIQSSYSDYFVKSYDFKKLNKKKSITNGIRALRTSVVSKDALKKLEIILNEHDIKIAHLHNIHHYITPAIIDQLSRKGIKIIWTLHDFKIICPAGSFLSNDKVCEKCITGSFYHCTLNKCKKNSYLASSLASFEAYYYHKKKTYDLVDYFLCPSQFLCDKFIQFGFEKAKFFVSNLCYDISIIDQFIETNKPTSDERKKEKFILYIGRLEKIKGVHTLINAVKGTKINLKIAGDGTAGQELKDQLIAEGITNVQFVGFKNKQEIFQLTMNSLFVVCPSICYENLPFSITESFLFSKPVVGSKIGGIPELVIDGETGLLFEPGNSIQLKEKLLQLWNNEELVNDLGKKARRLAYNMVNFDTHWSKLQYVLQN